MTPTYIIEVIKSVIGYFNLDPNRVLDIILESIRYIDSLREKLASRNEDVMYEIYESCLFC